MVYVTVCPYNNSHKPHGKTLSLPVRWPEQDQFRHSDKPIAQHPEDLNGLDDDAIRSRMHDSVVDHGKIAMLYPA